MTTQPDPVRETIGKLTPDELRKRCRSIMLALPTHDENAAMNTGDELADLLWEITRPEAILGIGSGSIKTNPFYKDIGEDNGV